MPRTPPSGPGSADPGPAGPGDPLERERLDRDAMALCLREAERAAEAGEVPVGAVIAWDGPGEDGTPVRRIVGRAHNQRETLLDPTAHAEMIALTQAAAALEDWRLTGCTLYVTLEPCAMCAGALVLGRVDRLVYGADDPKAGACGSLWNIPADERLNHRPEITGGVEAQACGDILRAFFAGLRGRRD